MQPETFLITAAMEQQILAHYLGKAGTLFLILDSQGRVVLVNDTTCELLGYQRSELLGQDWFKLMIPSEQRSRLQRQFQTMLAGDATTYQLIDDHEVLNKANERLTIAWYNSLLVDEAGTVQAIVSSGIDITSRQRALEAIKQGELILQAAQQISHLGSWSWDIGSGEELWSDELYRILGYQPNAVEANFSLILQAVHPDQRDWVQDQVERAVEDGTSYDIECRLQLDDGSEKHVHACAVIFRNRHGEPIRMIGTMLDITERKQTEALLVKSERKFRGLLQSAPDAMVIVDQHGYIRLINERAETLFGYAANELTNQPLERLIPARYGEHQAACRRYFQDPQVITMHKSPDIMGQHRDGREFPIEVSLGPIETEDGLLVAAVVRDISERNRVEEQLRLWGAVFKNSSEAIFITDAHQHIIAVNDAFSTVTGYSMEEVFGKPANTFQMGKCDEAFYKEMREKLQKSGFWQGEVWDRRKNGEVYPKWLRISKFQDAQSQAVYYFATFVDISHQKAAQEQIAYLSKHDVLTGLPNRTLLEEKMLGAMRQAEVSQRKVAVIYVNIDRFKVINETLGHQVGDALLRQVATRLRNTLHKQDALGRVGGDEYVAVAYPIDKPSDAARIAERLLATVVKPISVDGIDLRVTLSCGISLYPDDGVDIERLLQRASAAMAYVKHNGRNDYQFFTPDMNTLVTEQLYWENMLREALDKNQFVLHYQPKVRASDALPVGVEALIRWQHPERGMVSPNSFIPLAEETGLIIPIGEWVLRQACRQQAEWQKAGLPAVPIAVNVSALHFHQKYFVDQVTSIVAEYGIKPELIEFELTESIVLRDAEATVSIVRLLKEKGFQLSIDDFGTGYSSLSYLRRFPVHCIKIDQSFVRAMTHSNDDLALIEAIATIGRSLRLKLVAEGVETRQEFKLLQNLGCDELQGYFFAKPMPPESFMEWYAARQAIPR